MSLERDVENELAEIFKRCGTKTVETTGTVSLSISGIVAAGDVRQFNFTFQGKVEADVMCALCRELRKPLNG